MTDKRIYQIGLTMINGVGDILAHHLLESLGNEEAIFTEKKSQLEKITGIDFFHKLPDAVETKMESSYNPDKWML